VFEGDIGTAPHNKSKSKKIGEFYEKLSYLVQALETMKRLDQVSGNVSTALDKLPAIPRQFATILSSYWSHTGCAKYTKSEHGYGDLFKIADSHVRTESLDHSTPQKSSSKRSGGSSELSKMLRTVLTSRKTSYNLTCNLTINTSWNAKGESKGSTQFT
jgi:hypothetical protein